jgi:hypothetical protein
MASGIPAEKVTRSTPLLQISPFWTPVSRQIFSNSRSLELVILPFTEVARPPWMRMAYLEKNRWQKFMRRSPPSRICPPPVKAIEIKAEILNQVSKPIVPLPTTDPAIDEIGPGEPYHRWRAAIGN